MLGISAAHAAIFQLYHNETKLLLNEMKMRSKHDYYFLKYLYLNKNDIDVHNFL